MTLSINDLNDKHGEFLVKLARSALEKYILEGNKIKRPERTPAILKEPAGVFVTLNKRLDSEETLRGCIGYLQPIKPLVEATIDMAIAAGTQDPRFPPVEANELSRIVIEVTVLTPPKEILAETPEELVKKIVLGRDGLIIEYKSEFGTYAGTLLPQVPIEYGWTVEEFLDNLCWKAGLRPGCWREKEARIYAYQGAIWKEISPRGNVIRIKLEKNR